MKTFEGSIDKITEDVISFRITLPVEEFKPSEEIYVCDKDDSDFSGVYEVIHVGKLKKAFNNFISKLSARKVGGIRVVDVGLLDENVSNMEECQE